MDEASNTILFSHLLKETAIELDLQASDETSLFFADKRVSLMHDLMDDLKLYIHACGVTVPITNLGREIYARILSEEKGGAVSIDDANTILDEKIEDKRKRKDYSWTALPKAIRKSMDDGKVDATQDLFDRWYLLMSFISRDAIGAYDVVTSATKNLDTIAQSMFEVCKKRIDYYTEHVEQVGEQDTSGEMTKSEEISFIPNIYEPDVDDLYIACRNKYEASVDLWPDINPVNNDRVVPALDKINALVGHDDLKRIANELSMIHKSGVQELKDEFLNITESAMTQSGHHTVLMGNPTGKTTVARLLGQLHYEVGNLSKGHLVEVSVKDLISNVVGGTAIKTGEQIEKARGGVLFIDEGDKLYQTGTQHNFALQAVNELLIAMENEKDLIIIFAGYKGPIEKLLKSNAGLPRRARHALVCHDYTMPELIKVLDDQLKQRGQVMTDAAKRVFEKQTKESKEAIDSKFWGNAGFVRDYLANVIEQQELRLPQTKIVRDFQETGRKRCLSRALRKIIISDVKKANVPAPDYLKTDGQRIKAGFVLRR